MAGAPTPDRNMRRRVDQLERQLYEMRQLFKQLRAPNVRAPVPVRLAKTIVDGTYPSPNANTFKIAFVDSLYTRSEGTQSLTTTARNASGTAYQDYARTVNGVWVPPSTICTVLDTELYGASDGHWWIVEAQTEFKAVADAEITAGGSGTVSIYLNGADSTYNATAYYDWITVAAAIPLGTELVIRWYADRQRFDIIDHECV